MVRKEHRAKARRQCYYCGTHKNKEDFPPSKKATVSGISSICKECTPINQIMLREKKYMFQIKKNNNRISALEKKRDAAQKKINDIMKEIMSLIDENEVIKSKRKM